jgi:hypothetical protein
MYQLEPAQMLDSELANAFDSACGENPLSLFAKRVIKEHNHRLAVIKSSK